MKVKLKTWRLCLQAKKYGCSGVFPTKLLMCIIIHTIIRLDPICNNFVPATFCNFTSHPIEVVSLYHNPQWKKIRAIQICLVENTLLQILMSKHTFHSISNSYLSAYKRVLE